MTKYFLTVSRAEFARALKLVTVGVRKATTSEVRFSFADGYLDIMGPGAAHSLAAEGSWPSAVLTSAEVLKRIASKLPSGDPTVLRAEKSRLYIGSFNIDATILDIAPSGTQLPLSATGAYVLSAIERLGEARIAGSIGARAIESAKAELLAQVDQATQALKPYGVTQEDIISLVHRVLRERAVSAPRVQAEH